MRTKVCLFFVFFISCTAENRPGDFACPCKEKIKLCDFYEAMESYLYKNGLLTSADSYFTLIQDVRTQKVKVKPIQIWKSKQKDVNVEFLNGHYMLSMCIDSLFRVNPELYADSKAIINDFEMRSFGRPVGDSILSRASSEISKGANQVALLHCLWSAILESHRVRINAILDSQSTKGVIDLDSIDFDNETIKK